MKKILSEVLYFIPVLTFVCMVLNGVETGAIIISGLTAMIYLMIGRYVRGYWIDEKEEKES